MINLMILDINLRFSHVILLWYHIIWSINMMMSWFYLHMSIMKRLPGHFYHVIAYIHYRALGFSLLKCRIRIGNVLNWLIIVIKAYSRNHIDLWMLTMNRLVIIQCTLDDKALFSDIEHWEIVIMMSYGRLRLL